MKHYQILTTAMLVQREARRELAGRVEEIEKDALLLLQTAYQVARPVLHFVPGFLYQIRSSRTRAWSQRADLSLSLSLSLSLFSCLQTRDSGAGGGGGGGGSGGKTKGGAGLGGGADVVLSSTATECFATARAVLRWGTGVSGGGTEEGCTA
eukprot:1853918-Rhodomonas_salina.1